MRVVFVAALLILTAVVFPALTILILPGALALLGAFVFWLDEPRWPT